MKKSLDFQTYLFMFFLDSLYLLAFLFIMPYILVRSILEPPFLRERILPRFMLPKKIRTKGPVIWIHGVSVGEILAVEAFVKELENRMPEMEIVLTTTTPTGFKVAQKTYPHHRIYYFPMDFSFLVEEMFNLVQPDMALLVELEIWPNFVTYGKAKGVLLGVVNGRITLNSFQNYQKLGFFFRPLFQKIDFFAVQTEEYKERFQSLGADSHKIHVLGNLKFDNLFSGNPEDLAWETRKKLGLTGKELVILGGSTHSGEEEGLVEIYGRLKKKFPNLCLILAPRHPRRTPEILKMLRAYGMEWILRSQLDKNPLSWSKPSSKILVVDTIGELSKLYSVATLVFVGGSLIPRGGHNVLEPAALGKTIFVGPHTFNFTKVVEFLKNHQAIEEVEDFSALEERFLHYLQNPEERKEIAQRARKAIQKSKGAVKSTADLALRLLKSTSLKKKRNQQKSLEG